ncbi:MAG TPA: hypothetical protein VMS56_11260 [Thermoanaerobaculia bacterium]|nr:hypothetical protein [Thermoanaerobaculia bacterium]
MYRSRAPIVLAVVALAAGPLHSATVEGKVSFEARRGQRPNPAEAVVWLQPEAGAAAGSVPAPRQTVMTTRSKVLLPHVLPVPVGSTVRFPNEDPITHNLFSVSTANPFDLGLYRRGDGKAKRFERPGIVNVYCNVHPNMSAVVVVLDTPYWSQPAEDGTFAIEAPPGRYRLHAWHEQAGSTEGDVVVGASGVVSGSTEIRLDSSRIRARPHKNKEGKPYPRVRDY